jgi:putative transposase
MNTCFKQCIPKKFLMTDDQMLHIKGLLPHSRKTTGRPSLEIEATLQGIFYLLKTGCQWKAIPRCFGPSSTIHDHFQRFVSSDLFFKGWLHALEKYDRYVGLALREQSFDCAHIKAPLGGEGTGKSPVDRAKLGTKRAMLTDKNGIPIAIQVFGGNVHDSKTCIKTIESKAYYRIPPFQTIELDAAFDDELIEDYFKNKNYYTRTSPNKRRGSVLRKVKHRFRWSVERTHSWINRFRRLLIRWDKKLSNHLGLIHFSCLSIVLQKI